MSIMGCEAEVLGGVLIMGWPWGGRGDELLWDVSIRAKSEEVGKGWLLWDVWGEGLVAKGLQYYEMSTILAYMCMEYVCVFVYGGVSMCIMGWPGGGWLPG